MAEALIRQRVADMVKALNAKDIDGVIAFFAPNLVSFDLTPPLRYVGADNKRRAWQEAFATFTGPFTYEVSDLTVTTHGELAVVHSLNHVTATLASGPGLRPVGAVDRVLPAHRWRLAGGARSRLRPRRCPGSAASHPVSAVRPCCIASSGELAAPTMNSRNHR